jgi:hypothetical protein
MIFNCTNVCRKLLMSTCEENKNNVDFRAILFDDRSKFSWFFTERKRALRIPERGTYVENKKLINAVCAYYKSLHFSMSCNIQCLSSSHLTMHIHIPRSFIIQASCEINFMQCICACCYKYIVMHFFNAMGRKYYGVGFDFSHMKLEDFLMKSRLVLLLNGVKGIYWKKKYFWRALKCVTNIKYLWVIII